MIVIDRKLNIFKKGVENIFIVKLSFQILSIIPAGYNSKLLVEIQL